METKELKVQIPVGYEIDKDHSTFECIKFKSIKKYIAYEDVCNTLFKNNPGYFIDQYGEINFYNIGTNRFDASNGRQLKKLLALNKLLNIAEYYNNIHPKQNHTQYYIIKNDKNGYNVVEYKWLQYILGIVALFNSKEDAQAVIDNPNFREILNTIYKD